MARLPPRAAMARSTAKTAVTRATRREKWSSRRSCSSSGLGQLDLRHGRGSDAALTAIDLLFHGGAPGFERRRAAAASAPRRTASLVEDVAGCDCVSPAASCAFLNQSPPRSAKSARLAPALRCHQQGGGGAGHGAEKEPAQIACRIRSTLPRHGQSLPFGSRCLPRGLESSDEDVEPLLHSGGQAHVLADSGEAAHGDDQLRDLDRHVLRPPHDHPDPPSVPRWHPEKGPASPRAGTRVGSAWAESRARPCARHSRPGARSS